MRQVQLEEETTKARAVFRLFRRKLNNAGLENVPTEEVIREGKTVERSSSRSTRTRISPCWCSAPPRRRPARPAGVVTGGRRQLGKFPIPITIVPGELALEDIKALA